MEFNVTLYFDESADERDVSVAIDISYNEYDLLKDCFREDEYITEYHGLKDLCKRTEEAALHEINSSEEEPDFRKETDYYIDIPEEIQNEVES